MTWATAPGQLCGLNALHTVFDAKMLISCKFTEVTVQPEKKHWLFRVVSDGGEPKVQVF